MDIHKPQIAIVILTYNAKDIALSCLNYVNKLSVSNFNLKIYAVDNGSKKDIPKAILDKYPKVIVIDNKINYGFAKGINYGLKLASQQGADYLLLLNDDTVFKTDFLEKLVSTAIKNNYFICGPKILTVDNKIWSVGGKIDPLRYSGCLIDYGLKNNQKYQDKQVDFISGTAMLVHRKVFEKTGFMDEDYFLYYDDVDFCYRAKKAGFKSFFIPNSEIIHLESITIKKHSPSHYYHAAKSHLIFVLKRAPLIIKFREFFRVFKTLLELFREQNKIKKKYELLAIRDFFLGRFGQNTSIKPF